MAPALPFSARAGGVALSVRLTPKAGRTRIEGRRDTPEGTALAVAVAAPPEDGKANDALLALLASALGLAKSALHLTQGAKSRNKTVMIDGPTEALMSKLSVLIEETTRHG